MEPQDIVSELEPAVKEAVVVAVVAVAVAAAAAAVVAGKSGAEAHAPVADQGGQEVEAALTLEATAERGSWLPEVASHGEARTWADLKSSCRGRLRQEPYGQIPDISRGEKVGMCSAVLVDHGRVYSRGVLAYWW